jgi:cytochrome c peroxidase
MYKKEKNTLLHLVHAIADSIAAFEATAQFAPFDSKFDRVLSGEAEFSAEEKLGLELFTDEKKGNCAACHIVPTVDSDKVDRLFTDFTYDNLGLPKNTLVRLQNGKGQGYVDPGLYDNPQVNDPQLRGAFRVSGLRNIAVTGPYMHNGIFRNLSTTVHFYNSRDVKGALNPETQAPWEAPEIPDTMNTEELGDLGLSMQEVNAIVAFMETLTDAKYLHLIPAR